MKQQCDTILEKLKSQKVMILLCACIGLILGAAVQGANLETLSSPLLTLGGSLRTLGSASMWGNLLLWLVALVISSAPVLYAIFTKRQTSANCLLVLLSLQIFACFFFMVNPSFIPKQGSFQTQGTYLTLSIWAVVATFGSYLLLRFALMMQGLLPAKAAQLLPKLLYASAYFILFLSAANLSQNFFVSVGAVGSGDNANSGMNFLGGAMMGGFPQGEAVYMAFVLSLLPIGFALLCALLLQWCGGVAIALLQAPYASETILLCQQRAKDCIVVFLIALIAGVSENIIQLLFFASLSDVSIQWSIPLLPILLAGALFLLCHYVGGARALSLDNDSII